MSRALALIGSVSLVGGLLVLASAPASGSPLPQTPPAPAAGPSLQRAQSSPRVDPSIPVTPNYSYETGQGSHIEVYTSVGDNDGDQDWRQVNEFAYLVNSVPRQKHLYATIYNTWWDGDSAQRVANTDGTPGDHWVMTDARTRKPYASDDAMFSPTQAFLNQLNQYPTDAERDAYIQTLGNRTSIKQAIDARSGLSSLLMGGKKYSPTGSGNYIYLCNGPGTCLKGKYETVADEQRIMHSKYALFEQAKDSTGKVWDNVVWITSANLNGTSGGRKSNTSIAIFGDANAYSGLLNQIWRPTLKAAAGGGGLPASELNAYFNGPALHGVAATTAGISFVPSPRAGYTAAQQSAILAGLKRSGQQSIPWWSKAIDVETDALLAALPKIPTSNANCNVYVVHSLFSKTRWRLLNALSSLQKRGCNVKVVLGDSALVDVVDTYFAMGTQVREVVNRVEFSNVHDKTLTLSYRNAAGTYSGFTFNGSSNFNDTSLEFDDLAVRVDDLGLTRAVEQQEERLYQIARAGVQITPVSRITLSPDGWLDSTDIWRGKIADDPATPDVDESDPHPDPASAGMVIRPGHRSAISVAYSPSNATLQKVVWTSLDPSIATVDASGVVTANTTKTGETLIRAVSLSGAITSYTRVRVIPATDKSRTSPDYKPASGTLRVKSKPVLSLPVNPEYWKDQGRTIDGVYYPVPKATVTWSQGDVDLNATVKLQYYKKAGDTGGGKWETARKIKLKNGRGTAQFTIKSSRAWRVQATGKVKPKSGSGFSKASVASSAKTSIGYVFTVVRTAKASSKPKLYAAGVTKKGRSTPFLIVWRSPIGDRNLATKRARLQYQVGSTWKNYGEEYFSLNRGSRTLASVPDILRTRKWRVKVKQSGTSSKVSGAITVTAH